MIFAVFLFFYTRGNEFNESGQELLEQDVYDQDNSEAVTVDVYDFSEHSREGIVSADGEAVSSSEYEVTAPLTYVIAEVYVSLGQSVAEGDKICKFDTTEIIDRIEELESEDQKASYEADIIHKRNEKMLNDAISDREKQLSEAEDEIHRIRAEIDELTATGLNFSVADEGNREEYNLEFENLNAELTAATDNYDEIEQSSDEEINALRQAIEDEEMDKTDNSLEIQKLRCELGSAVVTAPGSGIITSIGVKKGSVPEENICIISDMSSIKLKVNVKESDILNIRTGMNVFITATASDRILRGTVSNIILVANKGEEEENVYTVIIDPLDEFTWAVGMQVSVDIMLSERRQFIYDAPTESIYTDENGTYIFIAERDYNGEYVAVKKPVETGNEHSGGLTEINYDGISKNSRIVVCTDSDIELYDGMVIEFEEEETE